MCTLKYLYFCFKQHESILNPIQLNTNSQIKGVEGEKMAELHNEFLENNG